MARIIKQNTIIGVLYRHPFYDIADFKYNLIETVEKINHEKAIFYLSVNLTQIIRNTIPVLELVAI